MATFQSIISLARVSDGAPGQPGAPGPAGQDANAYIIENTQEEILKFYTSNGDLQLSPSSLSFAVYKKENDTYVIQDTNTYDIKLSIVDRAGYENILELLSNTQVYSGDDSDMTYKSALDFFCVKDSSNTSYTLDFEQILNCFTAEANQDEVAAIDDTIDYSAVFNEFKRMIREENLFFSLRIYKYKNTLVPDDLDLLMSKVYSLSFGTSQDMATFRLTASEIQMAVDAAKLRFSENGLIIEGAGLKINDEDGEQLLGYNPLTKQLYIKGNGEFTGKIIATSGEFSGAIVAESGQIGGFEIANEFHFVETTDTDYIEGKEYYKLINGEYIISSDTTFIEGITYYERQGLVAQLVSTAGGEKPNIILNGTDGSIYAKNITLGDGVFIEDRITFGKAAIQNPDKYNGVFIKSPGFELRDEGIIGLGSIILDGINSTIYGDSFSICPELATFTNINCSGKITTMVFEKDTVQAVGGAMFFKPSYQIKNLGFVAGNLILILDKEYSGQKMDYAILIEEGGNIIDTGYYRVINFNGKEVTLTGNVDALKNRKIVSMVWIGKDGALSIGINSSDGQMQDLLYPRGLTIQEFNAPVEYLPAEENSFKDGQIYYEYDYFVTEDISPVSGKKYYILTNFEYIEIENPEFSSGTIFYEFGYFKTYDITKDPEKQYYIKNNLYIYGAMRTPKLYLGDLSALNLFNIKGYGLYSENVYLTGALTNKLETQTGEEIVYKYAGINTLSGATATVFNDQDQIDNSKIIFWAGADSTYERDIQSAKFQVTENGSIYAAQGRFTGSVIAESEIRSTDIYTARIHGSAFDNDNVEAALTLYGTQEGRGITFKTNETDNIETFSIDQNGLSTKGNYFISVENGMATFLSDNYVVDGENEKISLNKDGVNYYRLIEDFTLFSSIHLKDTVSISIKDTTKIEVQDNETHFYNKVNHFTGTVRYGDIMEYRQVIDKDTSEVLGYDLYIL